MATRLSQFNSSSTAINYMVSVTGTPRTLSDPSPSVDQSIVPFAFGSPSLGDFVMMMFFSERTRWSTFPFSSSDLWPATASRRVSKPSPSDTYAWSGCPGETAVYPVAARLTLATCQTARLRFLDAAEVGCVEARLWSGSPPIWISSSFHHDSHQQILRPSSPFRFCPDDEIAVLRCLQ